MIPRTTFHLGAVAAVGRQPLRPADGGRRVPAASFWKAPLPVAPELPHGPRGRPGDAARLALRAHAEVASPAAARSTSPTSIATARRSGRSDAGFARATCRMESCSTRGAATPRSRCMPGEVPSEIERIRSLVGVDHLDVFLLHRDDPSVPVAAWADALLAEVSAGRIGSFGVSNWQISGRASSTRTSARQARAAWSRSATTLRSRRWSPRRWPGCLAVTPGEIAAWEARPSDARLLVERRHRRLRRARRAGLVEPGKRGAPRPRERAGRTLRHVTDGSRAAYVLHQPEHVLAVVGTRSEEHLDEALAAAALEALLDELEWLARGAECAFS